MKNRNYKLTVSLSQIMRNTSEESLGNEAASYYSFSSAFAIPVLSCYIIIVAVAIVGNLLVCYAIMVDKNLRNNPTTLLLLSLAFSDLITVTVVVPLDIELFFVRGVWVHGELMCEIYTIIFITSVPTSIWTLLAISIERLKNLSDPLGNFRRSPFMTRKRALIAIIFIWLYSVVFAAIPSMGWRDAPGESLIFEGVCWFPYKRAYTVLTMCLNMALPIIITIGIYVKIYLIARQRTRPELVGGSLPFVQENKNFLRNMKAAKTIAMFIGVFFFCWLPYSTYNILISLCHSCWALFSDKEDEVFCFLSMCGYLTSALNPFLFVLRNGSFKNTYSKLISSALSKPHLNAKRDRRLSSLSELTFASEIPDSSDRNVQLQWIRRPSESELQITEIVLQNTSA